MSEGILSQQEIDNLLRNGNDANKKAVLTEAERDLLGEVGNISMSTAATALSQILSEKVEITTPQVDETTLFEVQEAMTIPNVAIQVKFEDGLTGSNVLLIGVPDASIIANLMMGGDGKNPSSELSELEISAVSEAMNQMIGSASTSLATIMDRSIEITPPNTQIWHGDEPVVIEGIEPHQPIIKIEFRLTVTDLIDSQIMQIFDLDTVKDITNSLLGDNSETDNSETADLPESQSNLSSETSLAKEAMEQAPMNQPAMSQPNTYIEQPAMNQPAMQQSTTEQPVTIQKPSFGEIQDKSSVAKPSNIDLIMDVPLEFSVVLGRTKRTIREILSLSPGSVVELDKLAEEPLEIYVNGKLLAQGEVVVINENFGIRITSIISATERVRNLK